MKCIFMLFCALTGLILTNSFVTDRLNSSELSETTLKPIENQTQLVYIDSNDNKKIGHVKKVQAVRSSVYLEDVLFALKNQEWSPGQKPCLDHIYRLLYNLQNFTLWAVWDWDALSSEPQGILFGNRYQLGNFDQCMNAPWSETHPDLRTKYCLAEVILEKTDNVVRRPFGKPIQPYQSALGFIQYHPPHTRPLNELTWGACVPSTCGPRAVERLLGIMLARSHLGSAGMKSNIRIHEECQTNEDLAHYDALFYVFWVIMGSVILICLICTYFNCHRNKLDPETAKSRIIEAFCMKKNSRALLGMKKGGIEVFYGIRYLTICLIVFCHQAGIFNGGPISDGSKADQIIQSPLGLVMLHNDLFVDTFFALAGFLVITYLVTLKNIHVFIIIVKRYIRLIVGYAVVVFYICAVFPYTGSGPLWKRAIYQETTQCRKNWWLNMLMISNYVDTKNICMLTSWYIPCDFHFFVVTLLAYSFYRKWPKFGRIVFAVLTTGAVVLPGIIKYVYELPPVQIFTVEFVTKPLSLEDFHITYIKSHTRYAAYLTGLFGGWIFVKYNDNENVKGLRQKWCVIGAFSAVIIMLAVMMFGSTFVWTKYSPIFEAVYASLNRPIWVCGLVLLVFCCAFGHVPLIKSFLSWYPWVPLSRLSYGLYLTHVLLITRTVFSTRNPQHNDHFDTIVTSVGVIFWGTLAAFVLWLFAEAPVNNLFNLLINSKAHKVAVTDNTGIPNDVTAETSVNPSPSSSQNHLHSNLPEKIQYSSKI